MDLWYILFNTLVYGGLAFVFATFYAYSKIQHLGIGAIMMFCGYIIYHMSVYGLTWQTFLLAVGIIVSYIAVTYLLIHYFPDEKTRDLLSIVFTLGISLLLDNVIAFIYWPSSIGIEGVEIWVVPLLLIFVLCNIVVLYLFGSSMFGKVMKGVHEQHHVIGSLWISVPRLQYRTFFFLFFVLALLAWLVLVETQMRATDSFFYLIKGIGIAILVWFWQKQWIFIWALAYVVLEYIMFVTRWLPIVYKETLILLLVLLVLLWKPQWLFSWNKRSV